MLGRMDYLSTRGHTPPTPLHAALNAGLAPDGGLYVPQRLPAFAAPAGLDRDLPSVAQALLAPFFEGSTLQAALPEIARDALAIPIRRQPLPSGVEVLELFHGPTAAFKDFAARFLAACMARLRTAEAAALTTVLVATSGDTGAAVAAAFHRRPGFRVVVLYPHGRVSPRQAHHLGAFGDNVKAVAVDGNFDDCQALVKAAFADPELRAICPLASANSISLGRLLPQISYYAWLALERRHAGLPAPELVIPSGNLGNGLAAILAREMGLPIAGITLATNANPTLAEFFAGADYRGRPSIATLANAMDVGAPSNFERLAHLLPAQALRARLRCVAVDDAAIRARIVAVEQDLQYTVCPHTACAFEVAERLQLDPARTVLVATAHPAKFPEVVEPLIGRAVPVPEALAPWLQRPSSALAMAANADALRQVLRTD